MGFNSKFYNGHATITSRKHPLLFSKIVPVSDLMDFTALIIVIDFGFKIGVNNLNGKGDIILEVLPDSKNI